MLRKAQNMCFGDVLRMELNVALNRVGDQDFALGVEKVLMRKNVYGNYEQRSNPGFGDAISEQ